MAFLKLENIVLNTAYIAAVQLDSRTRSGEISISILMVSPKFPLVREEGVFQDPHRYEWLEFTGRKAKALQDYFNSFGNVIDLLPQSHESIEHFNS
jgi:hypothetical protein